MYRAAHRITVITPSFATALEENGILASKIIVVPNFVDVDFIRPLAKDNPFSREHGLVDRFVVSHSGNIGYVYDLPTLIEAAHLLRDRSGFLFLVVGDGVAKRALEERTAELLLDNVLFLPFQPHGTVPLIRASSDLQVALYRKGASEDSMPSKVYEIMASGRPVLASADKGSDMDRLIASAGCGVCLEPEDPAALAGAIVELSDDESRRLEMAERGRSLAEQRYARRVVVDEYERLFLEVTGPPTPRF